MEHRPIIALLYDFDKTLCTTDMQNYAFIPMYDPAHYPAGGGGRLYRIPLSYRPGAQGQSRGRGVKRRFRTIQGGGDCIRDFDVGDPYSRDNTYGELLYRILG